jgi:hypothetical protein
MEEFTSWKDLKARLQQDLMDPSFRKMGQYSINAAGSGGSRTVSYRSIKDLTDLIKACDEFVLTEEGTYSRRTYAGNHGRGYRRGE